jgi:hypothetical protein
VTDATGAIIAGAKVVVVNTGTNQAVTVATDEFGNFFVPNLKPGSYRLESEAPGFKHFVRQGSRFKSISVPGLTSSYNRRGL